MIQKLYRFLEHTSRLRPLVERSTHIHCDAWVALGTPHFPYTSLVYVLGYCTSVETIHMYVHIMFIYRECEKVVNFTYLCFCRRIGPWQWRKKLFLACVHSSKGGLLSYLLVLCISSVMYRNIDFQMWWVTKLKCS